MHHNDAHPLSLLNDHINALKSCYAAIEAAKRELHALRKQQKFIIGKALSNAQEDGELKSLAQYLYLDAPLGINRDIVKSHVLALTRKSSAQQWLCDGYTYEMICCDCGTRFPCEVKSFTDLQELKKPRIMNTPRRVWMRHERCTKCQLATSEKDADSSRQRIAAYEAHLLHLRSMPYGEYLQSEHWKKVRNIALRHAHFRCQLCNVSGQLHVHHRSYVHRGEEQYYMEDVITLCRDCHAKHHDIEAD